MSGDRVGEVGAAADDVASARRDAAAAMARLASCCLRYAELRTAVDQQDIVRSTRGADFQARPGEFVADEVSLLVREQPYQVRCLIARSRRLAAGLPTVWAAFQTGDLDADQVKVIDRVARRVSEAHTLAAIDEQVVEAAQTRSPKQLQSWLLRLVVRLEPIAFEHRHRRALAERRVCVVQGCDGIGYVTGEVSAADAAAIDATLTAAARGLGQQDPRSMEQRRSDLFADLLLSRLHLDEADDHLDDAGDTTPAADSDAWLEVEHVDPDTGELLGTHWQRIDADGEPIEVRIEHPSEVATVPAGMARSARRGELLRIGVVVPLSSLLDLDDTPAELVDRSAAIPAEELRQLIAETLGPDATGEDEVLFTRLLTDPGGRLLDLTELGRYPSRRLAEAVAIRAGSCRFPTCTVPANRCDLDHHTPWPQAPTAAVNLDPLCRRHHRAKTFAWLASVRDDDTITWTMPDARHYQCIDEAMPVGPD
jgi:Domain of unknown function (DUF222)